MHVIAYKPGATRRLDCQMYLGAFPHACRSLHFGWYASFARSIHFEEHLTCTFMVLLVLPDDFDPTQIEIRVNESTSTSQVYSSDTTLISASSTNLNKSKVDLSPSDAHPDNPRKRSFDTSMVDDSYTDIDARIAKRARIHGQDSEEPSSGNKIGNLNQAETKTGKYVCLPESRRHRKEDGNHSGRSLCRAEQWENLAHEQEYESPKLVETCNGGPLEAEASQTCFSPTSNLQAQISQKRRNSQDFRILKRPNEDSKNPAGIKFPREPTFVTVAHMHTHSPTAIGAYGLPTSLSLKPLVPATPRTHPPPDDYESIRKEHALFWKRATAMATRESGPLVLKIGDVVKTRIDVNAKMFVPGDSCYGQQFGLPLLPPSPMYHHLPHEIWTHVAQFVPASVLEGLISVNSAFYDIAMDCRYRQMSFAFLDSKLLRNVVRLKDPVVAKRVRVLHVYPVFLKQVVDRERDLPHARRPFRLRLTAFANHFIDQKGRRGTKHQRKLKTAEDIVEAMLEVFAGLPNVTDYHIMWCGLQPIAESPVPFLAAVFRSNLRKLALDISLENIAKLLDPCSAPHSIEELDLVIRVDHTTAKHGRDHASILINHLAPSIVRLRHSLRRLAIQAWEPLDFSPLFLSLAHLPLLSHLTLAIPIEAPHLGDPIGFSAFLRRQNLTLRSLTLRATQYSGPGLTPDPASFVSWLASALEGVHIPHLRTLDISSGLFPLSAALVVLSKLGGTIKDLNLTGCFHEYVDVESVLATLRGRKRIERLERLRVGTVRLTPDLVDLLAEELPGLLSLEMLVRDVAVEEVLHLSEPPLLPPASSPQLDSFSIEMEKRRYPGWNLHRLKIVYTSYPWRFHYGSHIEELLATCVPSIRPSRDS
ncbi:hypothetical protein C0995_001153 [Termitomyces sp. Mi166|nr:hypothetical protein C0995_001153 [Termitomyces sp. Mi166\